MTRRATPRLSPHAGVRLASPAKAETEGENRVPLAGAGRYHRRHTTGPSSAGDVTALLLAWRGGDLAALDRLVPLVYAELRRLAHSYMRGERPGHSLQTTALIHEAFLRLVDAPQMRWQNRAHFFAVSAQVMRRVLVDVARSQRSLKRGGDCKHVALDEELAISQTTHPDLVALDEALTELAAIDPRKSRVVELRFFGGLTAEETGEVLSLAPDTVLRDWQLAKVWLLQRLEAR